MKNFWIDKKDTIEIRQVSHYTPAEYFGGKWYCVRWNQAERDAAKIPDDKWGGCQIADSGDKSLFLHKDGTWHEVMIKNGEWTGYYDTKEEAEITLEEFKNGHLANY